MAQRRGEKSSESPDFRRSHRELQAETRYFAKSEILAHLIGIFREALAAIAVMRRWRWFFLATAPVRLRLRQRVGRQPSPDAGRVMTVVMLRAGGASSTPWHPSSTRTSRLTGSSTDDDGQLIRAGFASYFPSGFSIFTSSRCTNSLPQTTCPVLSGSSSPAMPETTPPASRIMIWPAATSQGCRLRSQ
jgi:hypothetical protein